MVSCVFVQTLQERVCEFQARLRSEDAAKRLLLQRLQTHDHQLNQDIHQSEEQSSINQEPQEQLRLQDGQLNQAVSPTGERESPDMRLSNWHIYNKYIYFLSCNLKRGKKDLVYGFEIKWVGWVNVLFSFKKKS